MSSEQDVKTLKWAFESQHQGTIAREYDVWYTDP